MFIPIGSLPLGYAAKAKLQSEQSHHITPPDTFDNNVNTELVLKSIFHYITVSYSPKFAFRNF